MKRRKKFTPVFEDPSKAKWAWAKLWGFSASPCYLSQNPEKYEASMRHFFNGLLREKNHDQDGYLWLEFELNNGQKIKIKPRSQPIPQKQWQG